MKHYVSLSQFPGKQGQYFYTEFFKLYKIDADYTPLSATLENLEKVVREIRSQDVNGISVSMPFKKLILRYLDGADASVVDYDSCNTILVKNRKLYGHNADLAGVRYIGHTLKNKNISILGNGSIGKMFAQFLTRSGNFKVNLYSRSLGNWGSRHDAADVIINCTALGTIDQSSPIDYIDSSTKLIVDLSIKPGQLAQQAKDAGVDYISGQEFYKHQFREQFFLYTGMHPDTKDYERIAKART